MACRIAFGTTLTQLPFFFPAGQFDEFLDVELSAEALVLLKIRPDLS